MADQQKADEKPVVERAERVLELEDDDDGSSEFSVISMHDDQESVGGELLSASHVYVDASEVAESEIPDARSINSQSVVMSPMLTSYVNEEMAKELEVSAPWQPEALSGYVSTALVSDMINKISRDYQKSHEMLASINSSLCGLKVSEHFDQASQCESPVDVVAEQMAVVQDELAAAKLEMEQLKAELAKKNQEAESANQKAAEFANEKSELLVKMKKLEDENVNVQQLEKLLHDQCQWNKNLREQLDLTQDALTLTRRELADQKEIAAVLQVSDRAAAERMRTSHEDYQNQVSSLEAILQSSYERNETNTSPFFGEQQNSSAAGSSAESSPRVSSSPIVAGPSVVRAAPHRFSTAPSTTGAEFQVFLCKCLHAFPTRGALVTHKAKCLVAEQEA